MAVEKMKMMSVVALKKDAHAVLEQIVLSASVHIGSSPDSSNFTMGYAMSRKDILLKAGVDINRIVPYQSSRTFEKKKYRDLLDRLFLFIGIDEEDVKNAPIERLNTDEHLKYLGELDEQATTIRDYEAENDSAIAKTRTFIRALEYFSGSEVSLSSLLKMKHIKVSVGEVPNIAWKKIKENYDNIRGIIVHIGSTAKSEVIMFFTPAEFEEDTVRFLQSVSFEETQMQADDMPAKELLTMKKAELEELMKQKDRVQKAKEVFVDMYKERVEALYYRYKLIEKIEYLETNTAESENFMIFNAFVPVSQMQSIKESIESQAENAIVEFESDRKISKPLTIPTKLRNNALIAPFETLVKMYSVPSYTEADPTPFFAFTYMLLFGLMFGDVGQGIVLVAAGTILKDKFGSLSGIIRRIGISSTIFGFIYGSVFGMEDIIPALVIRPMDQINTILIFAVGLGVVLVTIAYFIGFYNLKKNGKYADLYFDKNGISGFLFYLSFLLSVFNAAAGERYFGSAASAVTMITAVIMIVTTCLMVMKLKLKPMVEKSEDENEEKFSAVESGFEMFETIMSFFSNTLSFIRVGAFAINHVGLFMAFHALGQMIGNTAGNIAMIILGNVVILSLEVLIVFIQAIRLEYYELFGKYFTGGGELYNPLKVELKK